MLTRAARQQIRHRLRQNAIIAEYRQLALPFLCPAFVRPIRQTRNASSIATSPAPPRPRSRSPNTRESFPPQSRRLATATDSFHPGGHGDSIPFEGLPGATNGSSSWQNYRPHHNLSSLSKFDTSQIVIVPDRPARPVPQYRGRSGISGNVIDLQQNLYACVQIGRLDRAAAITRHISSLLGPTVPQVYDAHLRYFSGMLESLLHSSDETVLTKMQKWLELEMREKGIPIDSRILVLVIKATLVTLSGSRLDRTLRRYLGYAQNLGLNELDDTVSSDIYTNSEWKKLLQLCPEDYTPPQELLNEADAEDADAEDVDMVGVHQVSPPSSRESHPELRPVAQKGLGMEALQRSLKSLKMPRPVPMDDVDTSDDRVAEQIKLERQVLDAALQRWHEESVMTQEMRAKGQLSNPKLGSHVHEWVKAMSTLLKQRIQDAEEMEKLAKGNDDVKDVLLVAPFLKMVDPEKACAATILTYLETVLQTGATFHRAVKESSETPQPYQHAPVRTMIQAIGAEVIREAKAEEVEHHFLQKLSSMSSTKRRQQLAQLVKRRRPIEEGEKQLHQTADPTNGVHQQDWIITPSLRHKIGAEMLSMMIKVAELPEQVRNQQSGKMETIMRPVAEHAQEWVQGKRKGVVKTSHELISRMKVEPVSSFIAKHLPMLCPPKQWTGLKKGGYLTTQTGFVRLKDSSSASEAYWKVADQRGDLAQAYAAVDVISKVPWRVNGDLLKVMTEVWNTGEQTAKFAPENPTSEIPPEPQVSDRAAHRKWKLDVQRIENEATGQHSQRCYQNFQLEVARSFLGQEFYTPHNIDFRGRAYPIPPYFNHIGSDYVRALFTFAEGKPLGEQGLYWLKIHMANVYGFDKESLADRQAFVESHLPQIYDSAVRPLEGDRWWLKAEDPWQCLATCMELKNALDSPVPSEFVSHLPVQQDGSCNGLQHYAALGGDEIGARQVNLTPGDRPADIYTSVATLVKEAVAQDAKQGNKLAKALDGKLTRKCVKQPVMTNVYGVTFRGATRQVRKQLDAILSKSYLTSREVNPDQLASYVAKLIFKALASMFNGAHAIQQWLGECGGRVSQAVTPEQMERLKKRERTPGKNALITPSKASKTKRDHSKEDYQFKSTIIWTTPLGIPVVQPYREASKQKIETTLQQVTIQITSLSDPVSKRKQLQAFPPNFIHSLDATHMFLSALKCDEIGLTFASVHDSFWTHAGTVPDMNRVLRDAFVRMHSEDIIGRLREEFIARYSGCFYRAIVTTNSRVGRKIQAHIRATKGRYLKFHKNTTVTHEAQIDDLFVEEERSRLLRSEDEHERKRGEAIVTPASIFEAEGGEDDALVPEDVPMLGQTPEGAEGLAKEAMAEVQDGMPETETVPIPDAEEVVGVTAPEDPTMSGTNQEAQDLPPKTRKRAGITMLAPKAHISKISFWRPMTFPPTPKRGTFDVTTLKDSQYFFS